MTEPLVDRRFLEKLERLTLEWQKPFNGLVGGRHASRFAGGGQEFLEHRSFHYGDDLRAVNWRAYMRFDKLFLKMFQIEPRVPVRLLIDGSASMEAACQPGEWTKFDYARRIAAALVYIGLVRLDSILLQPFAPSLLEPFLASGGRHRFQTAEMYLRRLRAHGKTNFFETVRQYLRANPQRGLSIVISDFLDDSDCLQPLQYLADFGHELSLIQLWSEQDRQPSAEGEMDLVDVESGNRMRLIVDERSRGAYTNAFDQYASALRQLAVRNGGRYAGLSTRVPLEEAIFGSFSMVQGVG